jgi:hypothetical protein
MVEALAVRCWVFIICPSLIHILTLIQCHAVSTATWAQHAQGFFAFGLPPLRFLLFQKQPASTGLALYQETVIPCFFHFDNKKRSCRRV